MMTEHEEQTQLIKWRDQYAALRWPHLCLPDGRFPLFAIPNGGERHPAVAAKLKAEGVLSGVPVLFLAVKTDHHPGLFIEMKRRKGGRISPAQAAWMEHLEGQGYRVVVARGSDEAIAAIGEYLR